MNYLFSIMITILFISCKDDRSSLISNESMLKSEYSINLGWDDIYERSKTAVHIKWDEWIINDSTTFQRYIINKIKPDGSDATIGYEDTISSTSHTISFPTGEFLGIYIIAEYQNITEEALMYISSDTIQFFTQPLSAISNLSVDPAPFNNIINWDPNEDDDIDSLIIYRKLIGQDQDFPDLVINSSNGLPEDVNIQENNIGSWLPPIYNGTNSDTTFSDITFIVSDYKYFYLIKVQKEEAANYRYSLIAPAISEMTNQIQVYDLNFSVTTHLENKILLKWNIYPGDDFYNYQIWRSELETSDTSSLENNGEKLAEIIKKDQNFFEDRDSIGSEKSWYYFIKVFNNYGDNFESNIVEGDTQL